MTRVTTRIQSFFSSIQPLYWMLFGIFAYFFIQKLFLHFGLHTGYNDLYFKDHSTWNITQGKGLFLNDANQSYFSLHFYPFFYLLAPFYWIKATPVWMFLSHAILSVLLAYPILKTAEERFGKKGLIATFILLIGYYPFRKHGTLDIFGETLYAPALAWIIYWIDKGRHRPALILIFLLPFCKENVAAVLVPIGLYYGLFQKRWALGLGIALYGILASAYLVLSFIPSFQSTGVYHYFGHYGYLGNGLSEQLTTLLTRPFYVLQHFLAPEKLLYVFLLFAPLGFLAFGSPFIVLSFGLLAQGMLSDNPRMYGIYSHYAPAMIPIVFLGSLHVLHRMKSTWASDRFERILKWLKRVALFFLTLSFLAFIILEIRAFIIDRHTLDSHRIMHKIPKDASVSASFHYVVHLHYREDLYIYPQRIGEVDYVIFRDHDHTVPFGADPWKELQKRWKETSPWKILWIFIKGQRYITHEEHDAFQALKHDPRYTLISQGHHVYLFKKTVP